MTNPDSQSVAAVLVDVFGDVRLVEVDPDRRDLILALLDADDVHPVNAPGRLTLLVDAHGARHGRRLNLSATFLLYPRDPVRGDVLVFGRGEGGTLTDVPDEFLLVFDVDLTTSGDTP